MRFGAATLVARFGSRSIALAREVRSGQRCSRQGANPLRRRWPACQISRMATDN